jgi:hypothetical protein
MSNIKCFFQEWKLHLFLPKFILKSKNKITFYQKFYETYWKAIEIYSGYAYWKQYCSGCLRVLMGELLMNWIDSFQYHFGLAKSFIQTLLSTLVVLITAEFFESFFQIYANTLIKFSLYRHTYFTFYFIWSLLFLSGFLILFLKNFLGQTGIKYSFISAR